MPSISEDKVEYVLPFLLSHLRAHADTHARGGGNCPAFFLGVNGVQGAGKTTLVNLLAVTLRAPPYNLVTAVLSIDDLYLPYQKQCALAAAHPQNPLVQHRGQPGTHDIELGAEVFARLQGGLVTHIPSYDKSAHRGAGDRVDETRWEVLNSGDAKVQVVIFEGWCVGFQSLGARELEERWHRAATEKTEAGDAYQGRLGLNRFQDIHQLGALIHIDAEDPHWVYAWRSEQEAELRAEKGCGMTDDQVQNFVDGYYPAYELYTDKLRKGIFGAKDRRQLRLIVGRDRKVKEAVLL